MKFYLVQSKPGETDTCLPTFTDAVVRATNLGPGATVTQIDCPVNAETIQRLLGNIGGYATSTKVIYESR